MKCPECQTENQQDAIYCHDCGMKLIKENKMEDRNLENNKEAKTDRDIPHVFISYHSGDVKIATAFADLILSAGGERVMPFYCEQDDRQYGENWFKEITEKIYKSKNMVCLLTKESCEKPWILYEAGFAEGNNKKVNAILIGNNMNQKEINNSPLALLQACSFTPNRIFHLIMHILKDENYFPGNDKQQQIKEEIKRFINKIKNILRKREKVNNATKNN